MRCALCFKKFEANHLFELHKFENSVLILLGLSPMFTKRALDNLSQWITDIPDVRQGRVGGYVVVAKPCSDRSLALRACALKRGDKLRCF